MSPCPRGEVGAAGVWALDEARQHVFGLATDYSLLRARLTNPCGSLREALEEWPERYGEHFYQQLLRVTEIAERRHRHEYDWLTEHAGLRRRLVDPAARETRAGVLP